jgi:hypothetical protein
MISNFKFFSSEPFGEIKVHCPKRLFQDSVDSAGEWPVLLLDQCVNTGHIQVFRKSLRDFRPLRYSTRDGHAEGEHVNRGRDTPSFCPTL